jgi:hypothetical protein
MNRVLDVIGKHISGLRLDVVVVEKRKAQPEIQMPETLYSMMVGYWCVTC